jgi:hypothetical protein
MRLPGTPFHFSYCLNVHPGESLDDLYRVLDTCIPEIKQALSPGAPFGLGLRLANRAAAELQSPEHLAALRDRLKSGNLYAFSVNAFPFGAFHQARVKENVYAPDWRTPERLDYTRNVFNALAGLLPEDTSGSVSTVPLSYGAWALNESDHLRIRQQLCDLAFELALLEETTGKTLHLGLEPEPDCTLETTRQTVSWFEDGLFRLGAPELAKQKGLDIDFAEDLLRRHIGVCFDTCHVAMQFEDPLEALQTYTRHGIRISKVQVSAALECDPSPESLIALRDFDDGVYLHQVKSESHQSWPDLSALFAHPPAPSAKLRIHCHVPLHWPGSGLLRSTRPTLTPAFWQALPQCGCEHIEVETYTFDVLPPDVRGGSLTRNILSECEWALAALKRKPI